MIMTLARSLRQISLVFLIVIPIMALLLMRIITRVNPIFSEVSRTYDSLNNVVQENVRGIRVVKSFNQEDGEIEKFQGISQRIYQGYAAGEKLLALNSPIMQFFMYACMILISWLGAKAIIASGNNPALGLTTNVRGSAGVGHAPKPPLPKGRCHQCAHWWRRDSR